MAGKVFTLSLSFFLIGGYDAISLPDKAVRQFAMQ